MDDIDTSLVGRTAADLMDELFERFGHGAKIEEVAVIAYVSVPAGEDGEESGEYLIRFSDSDFHHQLGLLQTGVQSTLRRSEQG